MLLGIALALSTLGQQPMDFKARQTESLLSVLKDLPREQFEAARQIVLLGGSVYPLRDPNHQLVESIAFGGEKFTDAELVLLKPFHAPPLQSIGCGKTRLTNDGIARMLAQFPKAKWVSISEVHATDVALQSLEAFHDLEGITLRGTRITSVTLRHLAHQPALWSLDVTETSIDDQGLQHLENLRSLKWLFLSQTKITSAGLASLGKITSLETLTLNDTQIDDDGLQHLESLQNLETLRLDGTKVTNRGMVHIAKLGKLKDLSVDNTEVNEQGLAVLQNMPKLEEVHWADQEKATLEQKRADVRFHLYLPAHREKWKVQREMLERGELEIP